MLNIKHLQKQFTRSGKVQWIGLRPERDAAMIQPVQIFADKGQGLQGDRFRGLTSKRQVTLIQAEHLPVIAALLGRDTIDPALLRRNLVVSGLNLLALKGKQFFVGEAVLEMTGLCHPCSKMENTLGQGGYNAMRGHGGITAKVVRSGLIQLGNDVFPLSGEEHL